MRKKKSLYNIIASLLSYLTAMLFNFITQALIVKVLGIEYSGVNGLFTNIITMLSVAELGLGTTIIYKLYEPVANNDVESIKSWMNFYKICYRIVAIVVLFLGLAIIPLVPVIVGETNIHENIILLYIISLMDTVLSYIMTYKRSLLYADQKNYVINIIHLGYTAFMNITQIAILYTFKNYIFFLAIKLVYRLLENVIINLYVDKNYPYINDMAQKLPEKEKNDVISRIKAMFLQKISFVVNKGIDSITISTIMGIATVGYYTNYNLIATTLASIVYQMMTGFMASIGNLMTEKNDEKNFSIFNKINIINVLLTAIAIVGFNCCIQSFINVWIGKEYLLSAGVVIAFDIWIYSDSIRRTMTMYKEAAGICREDQFMYLIMAFINLISSIVLCKIIGISGVILGTAISYLFLIFYSYPKYIFKPVFKKSKSVYYKITFRDILYIVIATMLGGFLTYYVNFENKILNFIVCAIISIIVTIVTFSLYYSKNEHYKYLMNMLLSKIKQKKE